MVDVDAARAMLAIKLGWDDADAQRFTCVEGDHLSFTLAGMVQLVTSQADEVRKLRALIDAASDHLARLDAIESRTKAEELQAKAPPPTGGSGEASSSFAPTGGE